MIPFRFVRSIEGVNVTKVNRIVEAEIVLYCRCLLSEGERAHRKKEEETRVL